MSDPLWLADVLRAEGLPVVEYPGWRDRGHGDMGTLWGVVAHHTGNPPGSNNPGYIANHPQLGLCSQLHLSRDGIFTVCGVGIAWHAGEGSYPGLPANDANSRTIGIEAENNGTEGWGPKQYDAYVRGVAAILRKLGHDSSHAIGHKEWAGAAQGKWDPGGMDMNKFRRDIQARLSSKPAPAQEDQMNKDQSDKLDRIFKELTYEFPSLVAGSTFKGTLVRYVLETDKKAYKTEQDLAAALKRIDALEKGGK